MTSHYTEDTLVQQTTAEYLERQLGGWLVFAWEYEDFAPVDLINGGTARRLHE